MALPRVKLIEARRADAGAPDALRPAAQAAVRATLLRKRLNDIVSVWQKRLENAIGQGVVRALKRQYTESLRL